MTAKVWIVDDDSSIRWVLERTLGSEGFNCESFADGEALLHALELRSPDVILSDIRMPGIDGLSLLEQIHRRQADLPIIIMTAHSDLDSAVNAYQRGALRVPAQAVRHRRSGDPGAPRREPSQGAAHQAQVSPARGHRHSRRSSVRHRRCRRCSAPSVACHAPASRC